MSTINREAAISELMKMPKPFIHWEQVKKMLEAMPEAQPEREHTMEEFMFGQDMGNPEDGSL